MTNLGVTRSGLFRRCARVAGVFGAGVTLAVLLFIPGDSAAQTFTKVTTGPPVTDGGASRSVNWVDVDRNGTLDLFVSNGPSQGQNNFLYLNSGYPSHTFTKVTTGPLVNDGARSDGASWADADNDGDLDAFVANWYGDDNLFYRNNGDGTFVQVLTGPPVEDGGYSETGAWGDYDRDGRLDLYVTNSGLSSGDPNFLYHQEPDGSFTRVLFGAPVEDAFLSRGATWIDLEGDGDLDLFVANEGNQANNLYRNLLAESGSAELEPVLEESIVTDLASSFSGSWGDYDDDGDPDLFVANWSGQNNQLYRNLGNGSFERVTAGVEVNDGGWSVCGAWGDVDNDGDLDLFVTNAYGTGRKTNFLYLSRLRETGTPDFEKVTTGDIVTDLGWSYGCAFGDYDEDGDLDLFVARTYANTENNSLYRNDLASGARWMEILCAGTVSNASAIGATVRVTATIGGQTVRQMRTVEAQSGYCGQNLVLHFGLGDAAMVDTIRVEWPSGGVDLFTGVGTDQKLRLREGGTLTGAEDPREGSPGRAPLSPVSPFPAPALRAIVSPNPARGAARITCELSASGTATLDIHAPGGALVRTLVHGFLNRGTLTAVWDGADATGRPVPRGAYFYRLRLEGEDPRTGPRPGGSTTPRECSGSVMLVGR